MHKKILNIVSWLGILVLLIFQQQLYYTWHYHRLPNGELIKHYHPFKHNPSNQNSAKHEHSGKEVFYLSFIDGHFNNSSNQFFESVSTTKLLDTYLYPLAIEHVDNGLYQVNSFRGPPAIS